LVGQAPEKDTAKLRVGGRGTTISTLDVSSFLDAQLNHMFGASFAPVLEFEASKELGVNLYDALKQDPIEAFGFLHRLFRRSEAVNLIVDRLTERLHHLHSAPESRELLDLLARGRTYAPSEPSYGEHTGLGIEGRDRSPLSSSYQFSGFSL
jgi:hypothetical protein